MPADGITLADYWTRPVSVHGKDAQSRVEPFPETCGTCHTGIFRDWSGAPHSRSIGPGLKAQLDPDKDPAQAASCYFCHAPALEQAEHIGKDDGFELNPAFDARLKGSGVSCPVCHLRNGVFYGPQEEQEPQAGQTPRPCFQSAGFEDSEFCRPCHQNDDGYGFNGSVLASTYAEWEKARMPKSSNLPDMPHAGQEALVQRHTRQGNDPECVKFRRGY